MAMYPNGVNNDWRHADDFELLLAADDCCRDIEEASHRFFQLYANLWKMYDASLPHPVHVYRPPWAVGTSSTPIEPSVWDETFRDWLWEGFDELDRVSVGAAEFCKTPEMLALLIKLAAYLWNLVARGEVEPDENDPYMAKGTVRRLFLRFDRVLGDLRVRDPRSEETVKTIRGEIPGCLASLNMS